MTGARSRECQEAERTGERYSGPEAEAAGVAFRAAAALPPDLAGALAALGAPCPAAHDHGDSCTRADGVV